MKIFFYFWILKQTLWINCIFLDLLVIFQKFFLGSLTPTNNDNLKDKKLREKFELEHRNFLREKEIFKKEYETFQNEKKLFQELYPKEYNDVKVSLEKNEHVENYNKKKQGKKKN